MCDGKMPAFDRELVVDFVDDRGLIDVAKALALGGVNHIRAVAGDQRKMKSERRGVADDLDGRKIEIEFIGSFCRAASARERRSRVKPDRCRSRHSSRR